MPRTKQPERHPDHAGIYKPAGKDPRLEPVMRLAEICRYQPEHSHHVTHLALRIFDALQPLHRLDNEARFWLQAAAILHDIGWIEGWHSHHKTTLRIILSTPILPFNGKERLMIGSIARYHCKALPEATHDHYAALYPKEQEVMATLASFLRLADGLDSTHRGLIKDLDCELTPDELVLLCKVHSPAHDDRLAAMEKADLFEKVFTRKVIIRWVVVV
jgi:exopolyphosphatase/guanosine-5'-triphosphate,3'-diphosphate pyrophosphatase